MFFSILFLPGGYSAKTGSVISEEEMYDLVSIGCWDWSLGLME
jgi:hypothetical protein